MFIYHSISCISIFLGIFSIFFPLINQHIINQSLSININQSFSCSNHQYLQVSRDFHPNFSAKWRRYLYIFPLKDEDGPVTVNEQSISCDTVLSDKDLEENRCIEDSLDEEPKKEVADFNQVNRNGASNTMNDESQMKPKCFSVSKVNQLMRQLEGKSLSYKMFSRDTKASRST